MKQAADAGVRGKSTGERFASVAREMDAIVDNGYVIIGSPDEVAEQLREVAVNLNVGHLMLLLQYRQHEQGADPLQHQAVRRTGHAETAGPARRLERPLVAETDASQPSARTSPRSSPASPPNKEQPTVSEPQTSTIDVNGFSTRVWRKGTGPKLGFLAGFGGLPRWMPFLDELAKSRTVIVPSLPGFPGGDRGHTVLDTHLDWMLAVREILEKSDLVGADLAGSSVGASLALEVAAIWPAFVRRLAAIAPFGLFDETDPPTDPWAQRADQVPGLMCADPEIWKAMKATPEGANSIEWPIEQTRAAEAAARIFWPLGNTRIEKRLRLIQAPDAAAVGREGQDHAARYAERFARGIAGKTDDGRSFRAPAIWPNSTSPPRSPKRSSISPRRETRHDIRSGYSGSSST